MSHASSAPLRMTEMRERHLSLKRSGARRSDAAAGRDGLLWSSPDTQGEPDKLLWMEGGVEKDAPELDEPQGRGLRSRPSGRALPPELPAALAPPMTGEKTPHPPTPSCGYETKGQSLCLMLATIAFNLSPLASKRRRRAHLVRNRVGKTRSGVVASRGRVAAASTF